MGRISKCRRYVIDVTVLDILDILESISDEAIASDMRFNPLNSTVLTIIFLKTSPSSSCPIPPKMSAKTSKLLSVTI